MTLRQNLNNFIKEIKYARHLHFAELKYRIKEQKITIKEKNIVIAVLEGKSKKIKEAMKILRKWQEVHCFWIDLVRKNKKWAEEGGSVSWHKRWIQVYQKILDYLNEKK